MIASVRGTVSALGLDYVVIEVGGVGLAVKTTPTVLAGLRHNHDAELATTLIVREDSLTLYGFSETEERDVFDVLLSVSGVGPKVALAILAVLSAEQLRRAVAEEDLATLTRAPGVGKKGAQRMVLELKEKIGAPSTPAKIEAAPRPAAGPESQSEVVQALVGLGWQEKMASEAVGSVLGGQDDEFDRAKVLRLALRQLGGHR